MRRPPEGCGEIISAHSVTWSPTRRDRLPGGRAGAWAGRPDAARARPAGQTPDAAQARPLPVRRGPVPPAVPGPAPGRSPPRHHSVTPHHRDGVAGGRYVRRPAPPVPPAGRRDEADLPKGQSEPRPNAAREKCARARRRAGGQILSCTAFAARRPAAAAPGPGPATMACHDTDQAVVMTCRRRSPGRGSPARNEGRAPRPAIPCGTTLVQRLPNNSRLRPFPRGRRSRRSEPTGSTNIF
jgi:hypothetical protein